MGIDVELMNRAATRADLAAINLQLRDLIMTVKLLANLGVLKNYPENVKQVYESLNRQQDVLNQSFRDLTGWRPDA